MDAATVAAVIAVIALVLNLLTNFMTGAWSLGKRLQDMEVGLRAAISLAKDDIEQKQEAFRREIGENLHALRQKISEVELQSSREYVRRESFYAMRGELSTQLSGLDDKIEARLVRMEAKLDTKT